MGVLTLAIGFTLLGILLFSPLQREKSEVTSRALPASAPQAPSPVPVEDRQDQPPSAASPAGSNALSRTWVEDQQDQPPSAAPAGERENREAKKPSLPDPQALRGIYLTGYTAGDPARFSRLLEFARSSGLNTMVIDVKDDDGRISFPADIPLAREIGSLSRKIPDPEGLIRTLEENGIYPIARVVVFCDPLLSRARPEWAVKVGEKLWQDRRGLTWTNPHSREVWAYNVEVAKAAARVGFREIQFDYVRFPEKDIPGFTLGTSREERVKAITGFLRYAKKELAPLGVLVSADVFGLTTTVVDDMKIGQEYAEIAQSVDFISPMVYPSHYNPGLFGLPNPNAYPYETVYHSLKNALAKTPGMEVSRHRPWILDFSLYGIPCGREEVEAQNGPLADLGIRQYLIWNPRNVYTEGVNYSLIEQAREKAPGSLPPNELGRIMIVAYHAIGEKEGRWSRTPEYLRQDLEELYRRGYRPVNVSEIAEGKIDLPRGYSPVALTFDDGSETHFRYLDSTREIVDPRSAVGVLLDFHREHPDWPLKATFYVNGRPFGDENWRQKLRFLQENGFEVGNHTLHHADLSRLSAEETEAQVGGLAHLLTQAIPELELRTLALPFGAYPAHPQKAKEGTFQGMGYHLKAFLLVGAGPAPSPYHPDFDPYRLPRIQAVDDRFAPESNLNRWITHFDRHPEQRYVSDGDPATVTVPFATPEP